MIAHRFEVTVLAPDMTDGSGEDGWPSLGGFAYALSGVRVLERVTETLAASGVEALVVHRQSAPALWTDVP